MKSSTNPLHMSPDEKHAQGGEQFALARRSLSDYVSVLGWAESRKADDDNREFASQKPATDWHGGKTSEDYRDMLRNGWPEGIADTEGLEGLATDAVERLTLVRDVGGAFANVPAYIAGHPQAMYSAQFNPHEQLRGVTLVIDASMSAGVSGDTALEYAHKVMQLVAWLEAERIETAVYSVHCVTHGRKRHAHLTAIREAGQYMQPERIASIVHPAFLRRAQFAMLEYECYEMGKLGGRVPWGYGSPSRLTASEIAELLPESYSVILLPKVGKGDPAKAVHESINLKLRST